MLGRRGDEGKYEGGRYVKTNQIESNRIEWEITSLSLSLSHVLLPGREFGGMEG